jgi:serine/threonine protein kinase
MAPELLSTDKGSASYAASADIYSFGIIINAMWRRHKPYEESDFNGVLQLLSSVQDGLRPIIPEDCPKFLSELMSKCWCGLPQDRISATELMRLLTEQSNLEASKEVDVKNFPLEDSNLSDDNPQENSSENPLRPSNSDSGYSE